MIQKELFFTRFERFWHWMQAFFIFVLLTTGFEIAQIYTWLGYEQASHWHRTFSWALICLWIFTIFWHAVTGEWKQYRLTTEKLGIVIRYYTTDIFSTRVRYHPFKKSRRFKHNPLQRIAYLLLSIVIMPLIWVTGLLYTYYNDWPLIPLDSRYLSLVAATHLIMAFSMLMFVILHVYMAFAGTPLFNQIRAMITGYVVIDDATINDFSNLDILLIADDPQCYTLVKQILSMLPQEMENLHLQHVKTLPDAINILKNQYFDLVLLDLELSNIHFLTTISKIRTVKSDVALIVFASSAVSEPMVMRNGVQDFLMKQDIGHNTLIGIIQKTIFRIRFDRYLQ